MAIRELNESNFTAGYTRTRFGSKEAEADWREQCKKDKQTQKVTSCVARGCSVETVRETTLREFEEVSAQDVGGHENLSRLERVGAVSVITERQAATNRGELEFRVVEGKSIVHGGQVWVGGFSGAEWDLPGEEPVQRIDDRGRVVMTEGRAPVVGAALAEELIKKRLVERVRLRDAVISKVKQRLSRKAEESAE